MMKIVRQFLNSGHLCLLASSCEQLVAGHGIQHAEAGGNGFLVTHHAPQRIQGEFGPANRVRLAVSTICSIEFLCQ